MRQLATMCASLLFAVLLCGSCCISACQRAPEIVAAPPPEVSVSRPLEQKVGEFFETTGETVAVESVELRARVGGYLMAVNFQEGTEVKAGDILFEIDPRPYEAELAQAEAELASGQAQLKRAESDVARTQSLLPRGAASERDLETGVAAKETAEANIKAARAHVDVARLHLEWSRVAAPISGRTGRSTLTPGNLIQLTGTNSDVLTTIVTTQPMYVYFDADETSMLRQQDIFRQGGTSPRPNDIKALKVPVWIGLANDRGFSHEGLVDFIDNHVDSSTGTIKVRGLFANDDQMLTPGLFVRVKVPFGAASDVLLVTERAVASDQGTKYVLVVNDKDVVEYRAVMLGQTVDGGLRVVREGLRATDRVIVNGLQRARPGMAVTPRDVAMMVMHETTPKSPSENADAQQQGG